MSMFHSWANILPTWPSSWQIESNMRLTYSQSSDFFSGGGPQGWSIFSSIWNLTLALDSFSQIARWFVKSVWPIRLANVSLEKWHRGWFLVLKFDSHLCWWVAHSNLVVSAWPVPMYLDCRCSIWERMLNRPALSVPDILTNDESGSETISRLFYCSS